MLKSYMHSFESYGKSSTGNKINFLDLKIPFKHENIQVLPNKNYSSSGTKCVFFIIKTRDQFNFRKKFNLVCDEPNLIISIFYIKTYKNTVTYCIRIDRIGIVNPPAEVPPEYIRVFSFATVSDPTTISPEIDPNVLFYLKFLPVDDLFFNKINTINSENIALTFAPENLTFNILIKRVAVEILFYDFQGDSLKSCVLHIKSTLYPVTFTLENMELNLIKQSSVGNVSGFSQLEPNLITFDIGNFNILASDLSLNILPVLPDEIMIINFGKVRFSVINSCFVDQIITLIKTDYRDIYYNNYNNAEIVFSLFESKATFIFNKFCFKSYTARLYSFENFDGTTSVRTPIDSDILAIDILKIKTITFEFETKTQIDTNRITIRVRIN